MTHGSGPDVALLDYEMSNLRSAGKALERLGARVRIAARPAEASGADAVVLVTEWDQFRALDLDRIKLLMKQPVLVDLRNIYRPDDMKSRGFRYMGVGRG